MDWHALNLEVEVSAQEAVEYGLMEAGALGTETVAKNDELLTITAYFSDTPYREVIRYQLFEALRIYNLPSSAVRDMNLRQVANRDWLEEWKQNWQPVDVGRFTIAPPWTDIIETPDRIVIRIEPGMAFGTGTHETTRLCLRAIEQYFTGDTLLDVGTGTGILAIAAAKLNPKASVEACDTDTAAIDIARENAAINEVSNQVRFHAGSIDDVTASADFVCANLTADVISELLPKLIGVTCGRLVLSGILSEQVELIGNRLRDCGIENEVEIMRDGEWAAMIV